MRRYLFPIKLCLLIAIVCAGCAQSAPAVDVTHQPARTISSEDINMIAQKTIFFGHQSVGGNIIQGVEDVLKDHPDGQLNIRKIEGAADLQSPALLHTEIGQNYDPMSKIQAFDRLVRAGIGDKADVAFFKFCYVDFNQNTDVAQLFDAYKRTMSDLAKTYPRTTFVHVTVPLTVPGSGIKFFVKNLLGRDDLSFDNLQRHRFNELLRQEYSGKAPVFDLAQVESTLSGGQPCTMQVRGQTVPCLEAGYTDDGEHLNERGRKIVAERFLAFLAGLTS